RVQSRSRPSPRAEIPKMVVVGSSGDGTAALGRSTNHYGVTARPPGGKGRTGLNSAIIARKFSAGAGEGVNPSFQNRFMAKRHATANRSPDRPASDGSFRA